MNKNIQNHKNNCTQKTVLNWLLQKTVNNIYTCIVHIENVKGNALGKFSHSAKSLANTIYLLIDLAHIAHFTIMCFIFKPLLHFPKKCLLSFGPAIVFLWCTGNLESQMCIKTKPFFKLTVRQWCSKNQINKWLQPWHY